MIIYSECKLSIKRLDSVLRNIGEETDIKHCSSSSELVSVMENSRGCISVVHIADDAGIRKMAVLGRAICNGKIIAIVHRNIPLIQSYYFRGFVKGIVFYENIDQQLLLCVESVLKGMISYSDLTDMRNECYLMGTLTQRQLEILSFIAEGLSNKNISRLLDIKEGTVKVHIENILRKLKVSNRTHAAKMYFFNVECSNDK